MHMPVEVLAVQSALCSATVTMTIRDARIYLRLRKRCAEYLTQAAKTPPHLRPVPEVSWPVRVQKQWQRLRTNAICAAIAISYVALWLWLPI